MPVKIIQLLPDIGHQYFSFMLDATDALTKQKSWTTHRDHPFIRYRYEQDDTGSFGLLHLAVETNIGPGQTRRTSLGEFQFNRETRDQREEVGAFAHQVGSQRSSSHEFSITGVKEGVSFKIEWLEPTSEDTIDVDLIVDLGNSRTIAVLREPPHIDGSTKKLTIEPVYFPPADHATEQISRDISKSKSEKMSYAMIDSWMLTELPTFSQFGLPPFTEEDLLQKIEGDEDLFTDANLYDTAEGSMRTLNLYHQFVELSPIRLGGGKHSRGAFNRLVGAARGIGDENVLLSSPKRYIWDNRPYDRSRDGEQRAHETPWKALSSDSVSWCAKDMGRKLWPINGALRYMWKQRIAEEQSTGETSNPALNPSEPSSPCKFSRSEMFTLFALTILEYAGRQINSPAHTRDNHQTIRRRLAKVRVSYPLTWGTVEKKWFKRRWEHAIQIYADSRFPKNEKKYDKLRKIALKFDKADEAVVGLFPFVFAEIQKFGDAYNWFDCYGRGDAAHRVNVLNVDIGGGTTDIARVSFLSEDRVKDKFGEMDKEEKEHPWFKEAERACLERVKDLQASGTKVSFYTEERWGDTTAGDAIIKRLVEECLLPTWFKQSYRDELENYGNVFAEAIKIWLEQVDYSAITEIFSGSDDNRIKKALQLANRIVFYPLAGQLLSAYGRADGGTILNLDSGHKEINSNGLQALNRCILQSILSDREHVSKLSTALKNTTETTQEAKKYLSSLKEALDKLKDILEKKKSDTFEEWFEAHQAEIKDFMPFQTGVLLKIERESVDRIIEGTFSVLSNVVGEICRKKQVDLMILSGRISELPKVRELFARKSLLQQSRIIQARGYCLESWAPKPLVDSDYRLVDGKSTVICGGALLNALEAREEIGLVKDLSLEELGGGSLRYFWGDPLDFKDNWDGCKHLDEAPGGEQIKWDELSNRFFIPSLVSDKNGPGGCYLHPDYNSNQDERNPSRFGVSMKNNAPISRAIDPAWNIQPTPVYRLRLRKRSGVPLAEGETCSVFFYRKLEDGEEDLGVMAIDEDIEADLLPMSMEDYAYWLEEPSFSVREQSFEVSSQAETNKTKQEVN